MNGAGSWPCRRQLYRRRYRLSRLLWPCRLQVTVLIRETHELQADREVMKLKFSHKLKTTPTATAMEATTPPKTVSTVAVQSKLVTHNSYVVAKSVHQSPKLQTDHRDHQTYWRLNQSLTLQVSLLRMKTSILRASHISSISFTYTSGGSARPRKQLQATKKTTRTTSVVALPSSKRLTRSIHSETVSLTSLSIAAQLTLKPGRTRTAPSVMDASSMCPIKSLERDLN